jgi:hypothetical protein
MITLRNLLTTVGAAMMLALPAAAEEVGPDEKLGASETEAVEILRSLRDPEAPGPKVAGPRIGGLGAGVLEVLFDVLESHRVPAIGEGESQQLSEPQTEAVLLALETIGRGTVLARIEERFEAPSGCAAAIAGIGAVGKARDLDLIMDWALLQEEHELNPELSETLRTATTAILRRDAKAFRQLEAIWSALPESFLPELVLAVGASGDRRGLEFLTEIYTWNPDLEYLVTTQVSVLGPSDSGEVNRTLAEYLQGRLRDADVENARAACLALGVLEDFRCVPTLIDLLEDERGGVRENAYWALRTLTGKNTSDAVQLWRYWYEKESAWERESEQDVLVRLRDRDEAQVIRALREIAGHRLNRHRLALSVTLLLRAPEEGIRLTATAVLADLGSRWAVRELIGALDDPVDEVRGALAATLEKITGERREATPEAWEGYQAPVPELFGF